MHDTSPTRMQTLLWKGQPKKTKAAPQKVYTQVTGRGCDDNPRGSPRPDNPSFIASMAQRGRGTLEVRESKDPFHVTTNSMYGIKLSQRQRHFDAPEVYRLEFHKQGLAAQSHFPFLYQKASSEIGKGISLSDSKLSKVLAKEEHKADLARQASLGLRPKLVEATSAERCYVMDKAPERIIIDPVTYLQAYEHMHRDHNPLYTTTSNEIGQKRPSMATVVTERMSRCQGFSNSFNSIKYRDQGLNCYMSRSKVHHELDPHFI